MNFSILNGEILLHSGKNLGTFVLDYGDYNLTVCAENSVKKSCMDFEVYLGIDGLKYVPRFERVLPLYFTEQFDNFTPNGGDWTSWGSPIPKKLSLNDSYKELN